MPRSAIMITRSLKLNLKLVYQLTQRMMICLSKCRPVNGASTETNCRILPMIPDRRAVCTRAVALALAEAGAAVAANYRERGEEARAVAEAIHKSGGRAAAFGADVSLRIAVQ